ncbi:serine hydrolase domain-containing protein [Lactobacillus helveticus]|uniref:Penicillin-binding protein n=1 Tax=Lactobacillus helveticus CIRM-BIA 953 TaxID=1226335 RepID=U4QN31_LACHE|nr:serine hydrolase domain-containing protein [Lactobacillus helveticus]NRN84026.1 putative penicillin-binding protein PbpX [Lactobacillus helveticus]NRO19008.1 putative penicillin-binding protein PbpX [Lactobacillus helveticus]NRO29253.1 putative penicillin-binding protein PbpX [Lactobacillus helveticus]NRO87166.1 putative penicillin-binding protein PbpX [Lactobacillus helveticus]NRO91469.1 putative penicillin-binding protein PbpX [Lactobacillus helveticus]
MITPNQHLVLQSEKAQKYKKLLDNAGLKGNLTIYKNKQRRWQYTTAGDANSSYLINSVQKELTAGLIMRAISENKFSLDDKVAKFYPNVPNAQNISVLNLLEMTSGLDPTGPMGDAPYNNDDANAQKMIQDTHYNEQNFGKGDYQDLDYILLSHILEKVNGQSYETLFNDMYVYPLKLKHTDFVWADQQKLKEIDFLFNGQNVDMNAIHGLLGAGSVAMSNDDLYKTSLDLLNGKLLSEQNKDIIYAPGNNALHYRGGLYTKNNHYESNGNGYGYCNFLRISKDGKNAVVLQSADSSHYGDLSNSANKIYTDLFGK